MAVSKNDHHHINSTLLLPGCMLLGLGIGHLFHRPAAGTLIGIGIGLLLMAYFSNNN